MNLPVEQMKEAFALLRSQVLLSVSPSVSSEILGLAEQLRLANPLLISLTLNAPELSSQSLGIGKTDAPLKIVFEGAPSGHEFTSLVLAILHLGGHPPKWSADQIERLQRLRWNESVSLRTFYSASCHNCPDVVQALNTMAALHPQLTHCAVDGAVVPEEVETRGVMATPSTYCGDALWHAGRASVDELLQALEATAIIESNQEERLESISSLPVFDVLVIGGGPAGISSAIYSARKGLNVGLIATKIGGQVAETLGIENWIGTPYTDGPTMVRQFQEHVQQYRIEVESGITVEHLTWDGDAWLIESTRGRCWRSNQVIVATGAKWKTLGIPGEAEYKNKGVAYCPHCDGPLFKGKRVAVIGGGNSGVEAAIDLAGIASHVTVLEYAPTLRADQVLQDKLRSLPNVTVVSHAQTLNFLGNGQRITGLTYQLRTTQEQVHVDLEGVFIQIGLSPNTEFLKSLVTRNAIGEIEVDVRGKTNVPGLFAAGDATTVPYKQIVIAAGHGASVALTAFEERMRSVSSVEEVPLKNVA